MKNRKARFAYIGTEDIRRIRSLLEFLEYKEGLGKFMNSEYSSKIILIERPREVPVSAEREGTYYINRVEHICIRFMDKFIWFRDDRQLDQMFYWSKVYTEPCLSIREEKALFNAYKYCKGLLNPHGRWMVSHIRHRYELRGVYTRSAMWSMKAL